MKEALLTINIRAAFLRTAPLQEIQKPWTRDLQKHQSLQNHQVYNHQVYKTIRIVQNLIISPEFILSGLWP